MFNNIVRFRCKRIEIIGDDYAYVMQTGSSAYRWKSCTGRNSSDEVGVNGEKRRRSIGEHRRYLQHVRLRERYSTGTAWRVWFTNQRSHLCQGWKLVPLFASVPKYGVSASFHYPSRFTASNYDAGFATQPWTSELRVGPWKIYIVPDSGFKRQGDARK